MEISLTEFERIAVVRLGSVARYFRTYFCFIEVVDISELAAVRLVGLATVVLESAGSLSDSELFFDRTFREFLHRLEVFVVNASQIVVLELNVFELRVEDVHFAAVFEDNFVVEILQGVGCRRGVFEFDEGFPDLGLLEDEDFDDFSKGDEQLVQVVVGDYVSIAVVYANQENGALVSWFVHLLAL